MENHKYQVENYKTKKLVRVPDSEHIIVKNTHEVIISEADFKTVQTVIKKRHYPARHEHENLFKEDVLFTLVHELTHYYQWYFCQEESRTDRSLEIEANKYADYIFYEYFNQ